MTTQWTIHEGQSPDGPITVEAPRWRDDYTVKVTALWDLAPGNVIDPNHTPSIYTANASEPDVLGDVRTIEGKQDGDISRWTITVPGFSRTVTGLRLSAGIIRSGTERVGVSSEDAELIIEAPTQPPYADDVPVGKDVIWIDDPPSVGNWAVRQLIDTEVDNILEVRWRRLFADRPGKVFDFATLREFLREPRHKLDPVAPPKALDVQVLSDGTGGLIHIPAGMLQRGTPVEFAMTAKTATGSTLGHAFRIRGMP